MAEFCAECFYKLHGVSHLKIGLTVSKDLDLCEGCEKVTHVVVKLSKRPSLLTRLFRRK